MKKAKRLLSVLLVTALLVSSLSVLASARVNYKDGAITNYDDLDKAVFTTQQYATMALDEVDRMLTKEDMLVEIPVLGDLDVRSVNAAMNSVAGYSTALTLLGWLLGDAGDLKVGALKSGTTYGAQNRRTTTVENNSGNTTDYAVLQSLLEFLNANASVLKKLVAGNLSLGVASSFVDLSSLNVNKMLKELVFGLAYPKEDVPENITITLDQMVQDLIINLVRGDLDPDTGEYTGFAPELAPYLNINDSNVGVYDFVEELIQNAFNEVAVPLLNGSVMRWLAEICGVVFADENDLVGDESNLNEYADYFNYKYVIEPIEVEEGQLFIDELNDNAGPIIEGILVGYPTGDEEGAWIYGGNQNLTTNAMNAVRYVLALTGNTFFADFVEVKTPTELKEMTNQEVVAYVARAIINVNVPHFYIPETADTTYKVALEAAKQGANQELPQYDYSSYSATLDSILSILADVAAYNINQGMDMNLAYAPNGTSPLDPQGLVPFGVGLDSALTTIAQWAITNYGGLLNISFDTASGWKTLDDLIFALVPYNILPASLQAAGETNGNALEVLIKDGLLTNLLDLNLEGVVSLLDRNPNSSLNTTSLKQLLVNVVANLLNSIFPGAIASHTTFESLLSNASLSNSVEKILQQLYSRRASILPAVLPLVCQILGLSTEQEFGEIDIYLPERISGATSFAVYNGSKGLNTGYTDVNGVFTQDSLYTYDIIETRATVYNPATGGTDTSITASNINGTLNGGDSKTMSLAGTFTANRLLKLEVVYDIYDENQQMLTEEPLTATKYSYVCASGAVEDDNLNYRTVSKTSGGTNYEMYASKGLFIGSSEGASKIGSAYFRINRPKTSIINHAQKSTVTVTAASANSPANAWFEANSVDPVETTYDGLTTNISPWKGIEGVERSIPKDKDGNPAPVDGVTYMQEGIFSVKVSVSATKTKSSDSTAIYTDVSVPVYVYNDFSLPSKLSSALSTNRQQGNYDMAADGFAGEAAWVEYQDALTDAAALVYRPKLIADFETALRPKYEAAAARLDAAIEDLDNYALSADVSVLKEAVEMYQPSNTIDGVDLEWNSVDEYGVPDYNYFAMQDFVSHSYVNWRDARNRAMSLYDSQQPPKPAVEEPDAWDGTDEEWDAYYEYMDSPEYEKYLETLADWEENKKIVSAIEQAYALQQVHLQGSRLIKRDALPLHLERALQLCVVSGTADDYTANSWANYQRSLSFANAVYDNFDWDESYRSQVVSAYNHLIEDWKWLTEKADYSQLNAAIADAQSKVAEDYTEESFAAMLTELASALEVNTDLAYTQQQIVDDAAAALLAAIAALEEVGGGWSLTPIEDSVLDYVTFESYTPQIDEVNGYIYGVGSYIYDINEIILVEGAELSVVNVADSIATGTTVDVIYNGDIVASYTVILFGDVTCDGAIDAPDAAEIDAQAAGIYDWMWYEEVYHLAIAADINNDMWIDVTDAAIVDAYIGGLEMISQTEAKGLFESWF